MGDQPAAGRGEPHAPARRLEQRGADLALQRGQLLLMRRGAVARRLRDRRHGAAAGRLDQGAQLVQVHRGTHRDHGSSSIICGRCDHRSPWWTRRVDPGSNGLVRVPAPMYAVASMLSVQLGAALSTHLLDGALSPAGSAWLRTVDRRCDPARRDPPAAAVEVGWPTLRATLLGLGTATAGLLTLAYIEAVARIPLGTTGRHRVPRPARGWPRLRSHRRSALGVAGGWPSVGVVGLTEPWRGNLDLVGIGFAGVTAGGWLGGVHRAHAAGRRGAGGVGGTGGLGHWAPPAWSAHRSRAWPAIHGLTPY